MFSLLIIKFLKDKFLFDNEDIVKIKFNILRSSKIDD